MVDYEAALRKPIKDFGKFGIGVILFMIGSALTRIPNIIVELITIWIGFVITWIASGFAMECSGLGKNKPGDEMPEWNDWWNLFVKGFLAAVIAFIYAIPALALFVIALLPLIRTLVSYFISLMSGMAGATNQDAVIEQLTTTLSSGQFLMTAGILILVAVVLMLLAAYLIPAAILNCVKNGKFGKAFSFGEIFRKALTRKYFMAALVLAAMNICLAIGFVIVSIPVGIVFGILSLLVPILGSITSYLWGLMVSAAYCFYFLVVSYTIYGQVFMELDGNAGVTAEAKAQAWKGKA